MISREGTGSPLSQCASQAGFVAGYFREHMLMTAGEMQQARSRLVSTARSRGLNVDAIFIERLETVPDAFAAMVEKLQTPGPNVPVTTGDPAPVPISPPAPAAPPAPVAPPAP